MKTKKIIILLLAAVIIIGCAAGAWLYFSNSADPGNSWIFANKGNTFEPALSDNGCYFVKDSILQFYDYQASATVSLCSKIACEHKSSLCDAYVKCINNCPLFLANDHVYYIEGIENGVLFRRNLSGTDLIKIGVPGKQYIAEKQSVSISQYATAGDYLYYSGGISIDEEDAEETELKEKIFIGRIHLNTGKDEIIFADDRDKTAEKVTLIAAKNDQCLFFHQAGMDTPTTDPNYAEALKSIPVSLNLWDAETGEITPLFKKNREECELINMTEGETVHFSTMYDNASRVRCDNYLYNMETGEETLVCENATLSHLGGGYALHRTDSVKGYRLMNLKTGEFLPIEVTDLTAIVPVISEKGIIMNRIIKDESNKTNENAYYLVKHEALADGLQEKDMLKITGRVSQITTPPSTPSTTPTEPDMFENVKWNTWDIDYSLLLQPPEENVEKKIQHLPETVDNPDNLPVLKWVFTMTEMDRIWTEDAVIELNQMLADRKMPFRVQFVILTSKLLEPGYWTDSGKYLRYGDYALLASAEAKELLKDADLIFGDMTPEEMKSLLSPITEYVTGDAEPSLKNSVAHRLDWLTTTVDGEIYGIKQVAMGYNNGYYGWIVDKELMEKAGLTVEDFQKDFWEMDEVLAKLYKANGNKPFMTTDLFKGTSPSDNHRGKLATTIPGVLEDVAQSMHQMIGVIFAIDNSGEKPTVINALETVRTAQEAILRYQDAGYFGEKGSGVGYHRIGFDPEPFYLEATKAMWIPYTLGGFETFYGEAGYGTNGIAATSKHKNEASMLLNLIAEDESFRNQLLYGKEGRDYQIEDGQKVPIEGPDNTCYSMSDILDGYGVLSNKKLLQNYRNYADKTESVGYPIAFDYTEYEKELQQIAQVLNAYYPVFYNNEEREYTISIAAGIVVKEPAMDEELYDQVLEMLNDAGADRIIAGLQRQLDEWLANNPDWDTQIKPAT